MPDAGARYVTYARLVPEWEDEEDPVWGWDADLSTDWGDDKGFATPEEAAAPEIPPRYVRVLSVKYHPDGQRAVVELLTNEEPHLYPYTVNCARDASGLWHEVSGHN